MSEFAPLNTLYLIGLGSNMRRPRIGMPRQILQAAIEAMDDDGVEVLAWSRVIKSRPLGPSQREYANGAAVLKTDRDPLQMLAFLQQLEALFGRSGGQRMGQKWRARVLDLDILLWGAGMWRSDQLIIPHPHMTQRSFVLRPAASIAGDWRDPISGLSLHQLWARYSRQ